MIVHLGGGRAQELGGGTDNPGSPSCAALSSPWCQQGCGHLVVSPRHRFTTAAQKGSPASIDRGAERVIFRPVAPRSDPGGGVPDWGGWRPGVRGVGPQKQPRMFLPQVLTAEITWRTALVGNILER